MYLKSVLACCIKSSVTYQSMLFHLHHSSQQALKALAASMVHCRVLKVCIVLVFVLMLVSTVAILVDGLVTCQFIHYLNNLTCNCCLFSVLSKKYLLESCIHLTPYELETWKKGQQWNLKLKFADVNKKKIKTGNEDLGYALKFYCNTCMYHGCCMCWE